MPTAPRAMFHFAIANHSRAITFSADGASLAFSTLSQETLNMAPAGDQLDEDYLGTRIRLPISQAGFTPIEFYSQG